MDTIGYTQGSSSRMSSGKGGCSHQGLVLSLSPVLLSQPSPAPPLHTLAYLLTASAPPPPIHPARTVQTSDPSFRGTHLCLGRSWAWAWLLQSKEPWNCCASPASLLSSRRPVQLLLRLFSVEFHCLSSLQHSTSGFTLALAKLASFIIMTFLCWLLMSYPHNCHHPVGHEILISPWFFKILFYNT